MGFPTGKGEGDRMEAFPLIASFCLALPGFTPPNIWCICTKPWQGTAVIVYLFVSYVPDFQSSLVWPHEWEHPMTGEGIWPLSSPWLHWDKEATQQGLLPLRSLGWTVLAVAASSLPGKMRISVAEANFAGVLAESDGRQPRGRAGLVMVTGGGEGCHQQHYGSCFWKGLSPGGAKCQDSYGHSLEPRIHHLLMLIRKAAPAQRTCREKQKACKTRPTSNVYLGGCIFPNDWSHWR